MKDINRIFFVVVLVFSLLSSCFSFKSEDLQVDILESNKNTVVFSVTVPQGWKLAKSPEISAELSGVKILYDGNLKQNNNSYRLACKINCSQSTFLNFRFFVCKDICCIVDKKIHFPVPDNKQYFFLMLCFGLIGGLLLNIMPCIFPVLMLKVKHLTSKTAIIASVIGNYLGFLIFAFAIVLLKFLGKSIGWGLHFQNIYFLKTAAVVMFIFVLMSFHKINFSMSMELNIESKKGFLKNVFSSLITTLLAIPCTAPLLGSAATFAIQESWYILFFIFFAIATGFSIPYFLVLFMDISVFRKFQYPKIQILINLGVVGTFLWILWLVANRVSLEELIAIIVCYFVATFLFLREKNIWAMLILGITLISFGTSNKKVETLPFSRIQSLVQQNQVVIVNISADWCMSCQYNKLKISDALVAKKMKEHNVKLIELDFSEGNSSILEYIHSNSRVGIPFTIVYGPRKKEGLLLSELLSVEEILNAIDSVIYEHEKF